MQSTFTNWNDTIVAQATPQGYAALGIIRISGTKSLYIIDTLSIHKKISSYNSHTLHLTKLYYNNSLLDEVVVSLFKTPNSFTGEDLIEISAHGSPTVLQSILMAITQCGARIANPGEFSLRAFLNKKIDLTQAEAIGDLIESQTTLAQKVALHHLRGGFKSDLKLLKDKLLQFAALLELELDFSEEDVEFLNRDDFHQLILQIRTLIAPLIHSFTWNNAIKNGVKIVIVGAPNTGKSTLLNALLNEDKAIVSPIAGTTRDIIEDRFVYKHVLFRILDTAGLRAHSQDDIERIGMQKTKASYLTADIILMLIDARNLNDFNDFDFNEIQDKKIVFVANKADLIQKYGIVENHQNQEVLLISAKEKLGLNLLQDKLLLLSGLSDFNDQNSTVINVRHKSILDALELCLIDIENAFENKVSSEYISLHIREALQKIGELTGDITTENKLDYIFSKFCIGK